MASLHKLLSEDGFQRRQPSKKVKFKDDSSVALPIYICHDRRSFAHPRRPSSVVSSSKKPPTPRRDEPAIDDVAIKAMVAILTGYVGQYAKDKSFRVRIRDKCGACFDRTRKMSDSDSQIFSHLEMGIQSIEKLVEMRREMDLDSLQKSIKIMNILASLDQSDSSWLSACSNLYLSIVYKIARNDRISARHLLQVFGDSPFLARKHLLVELWDHFFLPHLLHIKIWHAKELEFLANSGFSDREKRIEALNKQYDEQMDIGTTQFANYYNQWLKLGAPAPSIPTVPLPSKSTYPRSRRKSADSSIPRSSSKSLYQAVFGPVGDGSSRNLWQVQVEEEDCKNSDNDEQSMIKTSHRRSSSQSYRSHKSLETLNDNQKSDYFRFLGCRSEPTEYLTNAIYDNTGNIHLFHMNETDRAIATICSSQSIADCETAVRVVSEAWLNSNGDPDMETSLSQPSVIQGILEVLYVSNDDEVLELAVSILAEIAAKSEANMQCILTADPNLDVSLRLMRSSTIFLKAAALLYVVKPKGRQMSTMEWIPLVLRVLEYGDQLQTLFSVKCSPHEAAYYFINELLTSYDEDRNVDQAKQLVSLGGLSLLVRRIEVGDALEKCKAASVLLLCIRADGSCRHYLVKNLGKDSALSLLLFEKQTSTQGHCLELLTELLCLSRRNQRIEYLTGLAKGWNGINALQIVLLRLQMARPEEQPVAAVLLLQLDLLGDPLEYSVYREEAIDALVRALDGWVFDEKIQEQTARALLIMGGYFSYTGEAEIEKWLLKKAGFQENNDTSFYGHFNLKGDDKRSDEWERKAATVLVKSGNTRLVSALSNSITNSIPCLARSSLVTVCWISSYMHSIGDKGAELEWCSILVPLLKDLLTHNTSNLQDKILASYTLHSLIINTDYFELEEEVISCLEKLSLLTWTAKELISHVTTNSTDQIF